MHNPETIDAMDNIFNNVTKYEMTNKFMKTGVKESKLSKTGDNLFVASGEVFLELLIPS